MHPKDIKSDSNWAVIIPARHASSRFPGKPLATIDGVSLIERVWRRCAQHIPAQHIIVATDDARIAEHCRGFGADVAMTSSECLTGTDRVQEVVATRGLRYAINVQGDEPLVRGEDILTVQAAFIDARGEAVVNAVAPIESEDEWRSLAVPKVVFSGNNRLLYMSRAPLPGNKEDTFSEAWKQICIYAYSAEHLAAFANCPGKSRFEAQEDIEILRFLEADTAVQLVHLASGTIAVDFPEDIAKVEALLNANASN